MCKWQESLIIFKMIMQGGDQHVINFWETPGLWEMELK